MTEFESRRKGTKLVAWIVIITLLVGIGGGWLIFSLTGGSSSKPSSVYVTRAEGGSLLEDKGNTLLTLKTVGNTVVKVDTDTQAATPTDAAEFFKAWNDTYGSASGQGYRVEDAAPKQQAAADVTPMMPRTNPYPTSSGVSTGQRPRRARTMA